MGYQFRLANWNEDDNPTRDRDARALRYLLASNYYSSVAFNNHTRSTGINGHVFPDNVMQNNSLHSTYIHFHSNTTTSHATNNNQYPSPMVLSTIVNSSDYNDNQTSHSFDSSEPIIFGSSPTLVPTTGRSTTQYINTTRQPSSMYPSITQLGTAPSNYRHVQGREGNHNNNDSSISFSNGRINNDNASAIVTSTGTDNASFKRSRSPDFVRGETSNQGSQESGTLRRRTNSPPSTTFQQESVNNNNISSIPLTPLSTPYNNNNNNNNVISSMLRQQVNQSGVSETHNSITGESRIINRRPTHDGPAGFFDDTPSYNYPAQSIIDGDVIRFLFPYQQETHRTNFTRSRRTELAYASTFEAYLYPSTMTGRITQAVMSTSSFERNNNFFSSRAGSSSSSQSLGWGFNGFNNNINNNLDLFDFIHQRIDDTFVRSTINVQQYVRLLPGGRVIRFLAPSIVPMWSNSFVPQQPQPPSDPSSYRLNSHPALSRTTFSVDVESNQYIQMSTSLARSGNHLDNNHILTPTSPDLRAQRNMLRNEDLPILDYSIVLNVLDSQELMDMLYNIDDWPREVILALEENVERVETGLTEEEILTNIETETHVSDLNETSTHSKTCTICQEDYVEGEIIGRLDCRHIYHLECIKQWLLLKNACPICKQRALEVDEDED
ncbi:unnamed protein product [Lathyrus sativus]|nr:unnamed protein product [Lathyrus sativus]